MHYMQWCGNGKNVQHSTVKTLSGLGTRHSVQLRVFLLVYHSYYPYSQIHNVTMYTLALADLSDLTLCSSFKRLGTSVHQISSPGPETTRTSLSVCVLNYRGLPLGLPSVQTSYSGRKRRIHMCTYTLFSSTTVSKDILSRVKAKEPTLKPSFYTHKNTIKYLV